ncbi:fumarylacetoacetate hydrolase family protein [Azospirillum sp. RWY-5-1]|uniref:Fumarylacetoacetate hydrolase family protein n=1 Tax=Azospirillum oleiclasticum TaxID=2735135 RepID=A0ABX2TD05_9PROT|nr:fumarylacetoacetate hydrolase family protein [Azospirillum oleiclasticum]NYZ13746.1 fumarylacetoacetate hydrolase family protein [Azospirillum oleiclasticum]NYZ21018.1 fumarylacetoacetate hydrolase family protein [Azospirillum oleiclasticum]
MKLLRYGEAGHERPGLLDPAGTVRSLADHTADIDAALIGDSAAMAALAALDPAALPAVEGAVRLGCPLAGIGKIVGVGLNYHDHARECGAPIPAEPILFLKATTALSGPDDPIRLPDDADKTDWEVELGVVIGRRARCVAVEDALAHVFGYCVAHDVSERGHQLERGGQWTKGKSHDGFCPVGPWLVTAEEVGDPQALALWCDVNGVRRQSSTTGEMIFGVATVVSYISRFMTLLPGDLIITGTPAGVGLGQRPPVYLKRGDHVRLSIAGLGEQNQTVV